MNATSTDRTPYKVEDFMVQIQSVTNVKPGLIPGFTSYEKPLRAAFRRGIVTQDQGDIPHDRHFEYYCLCPIAHPEICVAKFASMAELKLASNDFRKHLASHKCGSVHTVMAGTLEMGVFSN